MKSFQFNLLLANLYILASYFLDGISALFVLSMAFVWIILSLLSWHSDILERRLFLSMLELNRRKKK